MLTFKGDHRVRQPREALWRLLQDPAALRRLIPGCSELVPVGEGAYRVLIRIGLGLLEKKFRGIVTLRDLVEPESWVLDLVGEGRDRSVRGRSRIELVSDDAAGVTIVRFASSIEAGGFLARLGRRFIEKLATSMSRDFFAELDRFLREQEGRA